MKRYAIALLMFVAAIAVGCSQSGPGPSAYKRGLTQLREGDPKAASETFTKLDKDSPDSYWGKMGLAAYQECEGYDIDAAHTYQKVLQDTADYIPALTAMTRLALKQDRPQVAWATADRAFKLDAFDPQAASTYAMVMLASGKNDDALSAIKNALDHHSGNPNLLLAQAEYYFNKGFPDSVRISCHKALDSKTTDSLLLSVAGIYARLGLADSSAAFYHQAVEKGAKNYYIKAGAADGFSEIGYFDDARRMIDDLAQSKSPSYRKFRAAKTMYEKMGKPFSAFMFYIDSYRLFANVPTALVDLAHLRIKLRQDEIASAHYDQAMSLANTQKYSNNDMIAFEMDRAEKEFNAGNGVSASALIKEILDDPPEDYRAMRVVTLYYGFMADEANAATMLNGFEKFAKDNAMTQLDAADIFRRLDSLDRAKGHYDEVLKTNKFQYGAILGMLDIFDRMKGPEKALAFLNSQNPSISLYRPVALKKFNYLMALNRYSDALSFAQTLIDDGPGATERYRLAAKAAKADGKPDIVKATYDKELANNPNNPEAHADVAQYYLAENKTAEANKAVADALALDSMNIKARLVKADLFENQNMPDSSKAIYEALLKYNEFVPEALYKLAMMDLTQGQNFQQVQNYAIRAVEIEPRNPIYLELLGRAQNAMKDFGGAISSFDRALKASPDNAELYYYAGMNYIDARKNSKAREYLTKAVRLGLNDDLSESAKNAIKLL